MSVLGFNSNLLSKAASSKNNGKDKLFFFFFAPCHSLASPYKIIQASFKLLDTDRLRRNPYLSCASLRNEKS